MSPFHGCCNVRPCSICTVFGGGRSSRKLNSLNMLAHGVPKKSQTPFSPRGRLAWAHPINPTPHFSPSTRLVFKEFLLILPPRRRNCFSPQTCEQVTLSKQVCLPKMSSTFAKGKGFSLFVNAANLRVGSVQKRTVWLSCFLSKSDGQLQRKVCMPTRPMSPWPSATPTLS